MLPPAAFLTAALPVGTVDVPGATDVPADSSVAVPVLEGEEEIVFAVFKASPVVRIVPDIVVRSPFTARLGDGVAMLTSFVTITLVV